MATVRNNTPFPYPLPNERMLAGRTEIQIDDQEVVDCWMAIWPMTVCGDLSVRLASDPVPPTPDAYEGPPTVETDAAPPPVPVDPEPDPVAAPDPVEAPPIEAPPADPAPEIIPAPEPAPDIQPTADTPTEGN